ncbi:hypothetical protein RND81_10G040200 [Saponaria officinalis]
MCSVGSGFRRNALAVGNDLEFDIVFKAVYHNVSVVHSSLVVGSLESLNLDDNVRFFKPVSMMGFNRMNYNYTLINDNEVNSSSISSTNISALTIDARLFRNCQEISSLANYFELSYGNDCGGRNCSLIDGVLGFLPRFMSMNEIDCTAHRMVRVAFVVSNVSDVRNGVRQPLDPFRTLVAEGAWNEEKTKINFAVCRILNFTDNPLNATVGDCSIRVNIELSERLTLRNWSVISGYIWSVKGVEEPGYFDRIEIRASGTRRAALPSMKYEYTEIDRVRKFCAETKGIKRKGKNFPDPYSQDLKFDMDVKNSKGSLAWGKANPVFVGDRFVQNMYPYFRSSVLPSPKTITPVNSTQVNYALVNVAYRIILTPKDKFDVGGRSFSRDEKIIISAEGIYDAKIGRLCMVACWNRETDGSVPLNTTSRQDCDIFIDIQFPPRDSNDNSVVKGTIESKRDKTSDPFFFASLDLSGTSLTKSQVREVFWRMDFEIAMILISNTLACVFIGLQLFHVKKHPQVLPFISIVMLTVITLGHMIPLLLNIEAFFLSTHTKKTVLFGSGGWLEVNEVLVRVITMVAFLLEFRLLQLTWSARGENSSQKTALQESDRKVIYYCLPLYVAGALIAWLVQRLRSPPRRSFRHYKIASSNTSLSFWGDIKSYAGFILDAFLVPQIMFNVFSDSNERALSVPYFVGTTIVRLLPHGYDLFRAHSSSWSFDPWYIYADPGMNFYSTTWDILISCLGIVFVILVYLQQRYGGRWFVPKRFNKTVAYEMVPIGL